MKTSTRRVAELNLQFTSLELNDPAAEVREVNIADKAQLGSDGSA
jgi:hypothetical protein